MDAFQSGMLEKRTEFAELVKAAFVLNTSFTRLGEISGRDKGWLAVAFPTSTVVEGTDMQMGRFYTVTPAF